MRNILNRKTVYFGRIVFYFGFFSQNRTLLQNKSEVEGDQGLVGEAPPPQGFFMCTNNIFFIENCFIHA